jgi:hypothetical protein
MSTQIKTWEIKDSKLKEIDTSLIIEGRTEKYDLEEWILSNPEILGSNIAIIGHQIATRSGQLDLLGLDRNGNTVIIELKRDKLPREVLAQAIDYASEIATWDVEKISEVSSKFTGKSLDDFVSETFGDEIAIENININQIQRILLVGFSIEDSLERMIEYLSGSFGLNVNAVILHYVKTTSGSELLSRTYIIPEEIEKERAKKFSIPMSDEPGNYDMAELKELLLNYFSQDLKSAKRIKTVLLPECLKKKVVTRDELKRAFIDYNEPNAEKNAGYFMSLISLQIGMKKNDFLRQIISYEYPNYPWEKDNYSIREDYKEMVKEIIK